VWVEDDNAVSADEARHVGQVIDGVEAKSKPADLVGLRLLGGAVQLRDVLEVIVGERGVVVNPERRAVTFLHALVDQTGLRVRVSTLVVQKPHLRYVSK